MDQRPANGSRVLYLYVDGGGAAVSYIDDDGTRVDERGSDDTGFRDDKFCAWTYLPDGYLLFFEREEEELNGQK